MIKSTLITPFILLFLLTACDENETYCSGYPSDKISDFEFKAVTLYTTEETRVPCQDHAVNTIEELNLGEQSKKTTTRKDKDTCHPITIYEYELKSIEQKFFTNKENLTLEEAEGHIRNFCKEKINFLVYDEIRNIEVNNNRIQFEYGMEDQDFKGAVYTDTHSQFICPVYTISCNVRVGPEW